ncbi:unnamed protein product [Musa textilis]
MVQNSDSANNVFFGYVHHLWITFTYIVHNESYFNLVIFHEWKSLFLLSFFVKLFIHLISIFAIPNTLVFLFLIVQHSKLSNMVGFLSSYDIEAFEISGIFV